MVRLAWPGWWLGLLVGVEPRWLRRRTCSRRASS